MLSSRGRTALLLPPFEIPVSESRRRILQGSSTDFGERIKSARAKRGAPVWAYPSRNGLSRCMRDRLRSKASWVKGLFSACEFPGHRPSARPDRQTASFREHPYATLELGCGRK